MLAAVVLIAIILVAFAGIVWPAYQRYVNISNNQGKVIYETAAQAGLQTSEVYESASESNGVLAVTVFVYNYGAVVFTPSQFVLFIPGSGSFTVNSFTMVDSVTGAPVSVISPDTTVAISFSVSYSGAVPSSFSVTAFGTVDGAGVLVTWG
jgi:archaellum component FlaF (FlaF/FlaG flagellin family)